MLHSRPTECLPPPFGLPGASFHSQKNDLNLSHSLTDFDVTDCVKPQDLK